MTWQELDTATGAVSGAGRGWRRVLLRVGGRPVGAVPVYGNLDEGRARAELAPGARDVLAPHLAGGAGRLDPGAALDRGDVPRHPLTPRPRPLRAGEVTVAVPTNRGPEACSRLLAELSGTFDVLVVENGRAEPILRELCARYGARHHHTTRRGLSAARNEALARTATPWVLFLDDDCRMGLGGADAFAARLGGALDAADGAGAITGLIQPERLESTAQVEFQRLSPMSRGFLPVRHTPASRDPGWIVRNPHLMGVGGCLAVRREAWEAVDGFDERVGPGTPAAYADDDTFFSALLSADWPLLYVPTLVIRHDHRESTRAMNRQLFGYGIGLTVRLWLWALDHRRLRPVGRIWPTVLGVYLSLARRDPRRRPELAGYVAGLAVVPRSALRRRRAR